MEKLTQAAQTDQAPLYDWVQTHALPVGPRQVAAVSHFVEKIQDFRRWYETNPGQLPDLIRYIVESIGYVDYLQSSGIPNPEDRMEVVYELVNLAAEEQADLGAFLTKISLASDWDDQEEKVDEVTLMTLHHAKGLEYPTVFIAGLEEGILPHFRSQEPQEIEEERRLLYVGITRGRENVILSSAQSRYIQGESRSTVTSRFLRELPTELIKQTGYRNIPGPSALPASSPLATSHSSASPTAKPANSTAAYQIGEWVMHPQWGKGQIITIDGTADSAVLNIVFSGMPKKFMAKYAPLRKLQTSS